MLLALIVVVGSLAIPVNNAFGQIPSFEREALIALYDATSGENWGQNAGWLDAVGTECTWFGVDCSGGIVWNLILDDNGLTGSIPPELTNLTSLSSLLLSENQLSGTIPQEVWGMTSLTGLYLQGNQLTGVIPSEIGQLTNLTNLYLSDNDLSGPIPPTIGNLTGLSDLNLDRNEFTGPIPNELGELTSLQILYLNSNGLSGGIPSELGNLTALRWFSLAGNEIEGMIPIEFANLGSLNPLVDIGFNALWTDDPMLQAFLDSKDSDWDQTQTIAPKGLSAVRGTNSSVSVTWTPIIYTSDNGGYRVSYSTTSAGPYSFLDITSSKTDNVLTVQGMPLGSDLYFIVESQTDPHAANQNTVISEPSAAAMVASQDAPIPMMNALGVAVFISILLLAGAYLLRR